MKYIKLFENFSESSEIEIPEEFSGLVGEVGGLTTTPETIIDLYNELVSPGDFGDIPQLVSYDGKFHDENGDVRDLGAILDEINYALIDEDYPGENYFSGL